MNPVLLRISDSIQLRWYGLAYVAGFIAGWWLLTRWARRGVGVLKESEVSDFITYAAIFGVMLGGRLGYMLLYSPAAFFADPSIFFHVTGGGMASHGGILGLFLYTLYWSKRHKVSWTGLGDNLVTAAPLGLFFGRIANFINGELYGRIAPGFRWAMKFPSAAGTWSEGSEDPVIAAKARAVSALIDTHLAAHPIPPGTPEIPWHEAIQTFARTDETFAEGLRPLLSPRHPSQLYEAALEGVLLFAILFFVRERWPKAPHGLLTGLFFILYAIFRMAGEQFREPDRYIAGLTEGQFYSTFMILVGLAFLVFAWKHRGKADPGPRVDKETAC